MNAGLSTPAQIRRIHILKAKLSLDDTTYRDIVRQYGAQSSTNLSVANAVKLIGDLTIKAVNAGVWENRTARKWDHLGRRDGMASPAQLRMIEAMWAQVSVMKTSGDRSKALDHFCLRITGVSSLQWLETADVRKIVRALAEMVKQHNTKKDAQ